MTAAARVSRVRVGDAVDGAAVGEARPRVRWTVDGDGGFDAVGAEAEFVRGDVVARLPLDIRPGSSAAWPFEPLGSRDRGALRVRAADAAGTWTAWSSPTIVEAGMLQASDWTADFISPVGRGGEEDGAPVLFTDFTLEAAPVSARVFASAHGVYELSINGARVGADVFEPGWTDYRTRTRYQVYDVTHLVGAGANGIVATLGNGWYRGQLVWHGNRSSYGERLALLVQLELEFADGTRRTIGTDATWRSTDGRVVADDFYDGETQDLRRPDADLVHAGPVEVVPATDALVARRGPAVRVTERRAAASVHRAPSGRLVVDFGQNLVGWVELVVRGRAAGDVVEVRHAEVLEGGELARRPLRSAQATCRYTCAGDGEESLRPTFTFHGFRYADILGVDESDIVRVEAVVVGTDLERIGWLRTSDPMLDRLHDNVVWSTRGNFLSVPTDCPQRDERLGWTGDIQVFAPTAAYLYDTSGFLAGWLDDLAAGQLADGSVPYVVPDVLRQPVSPAAAGWGDAAATVPWALHLAYDDPGMLRRQYSSMTAWLDHVASLADDDGVWDSPGQFGDWLDPTAPPDDPAAAKADPAVVATAYFARTARTVALVAEELGETTDAARHRALANRISQGFQRRFVARDGLVRSDCQTVYALALVGGLIDDETARTGAARRLVELVEAADATVSTGFLGTPWILDALVVADRPDLAFRMLRQTAPPSWLYAVTMGATTVWERWDALLEDGSVHPGEMTSFNHYAYGAVADWMHRRIGGIAPLAPGYRRFEVRPLVTVDLEDASARHVSPYGEIRVEWRRSGGSVELKVRVPAGTTASVWVPGAEGPVTAGPGAHRWTGVLAADTADAAGR
jgi:alpha-L-rhamnosidase